MKNLLLLLNKFEKKMIKNILYKFHCFFENAIEKNNLHNYPQTVYTTIHQYDKESLPNIILVKKHYANVNCK